MATIRFKNLKPAVKQLQKKVERAAVNGILRSSQTIENEIIVTILSGESPVRGKKFQQYSKKYANKFKGGARRPVNMKVTGAMLDSINIKKVAGKNSISINFTSKIAIFHDILGAGASKVIRRLLPNTSKGETFKSNIVNEMKKAVLQGLNKLK